MQLAVDGVDRCYSSAASDGGPLSGGAMTATTALGGRMHQQQGPTSDLDLDLDDESGDEIEDCCRSPSSSSPRCCSAGPPGASGGEHGGSTNGGGGCKRKKKTRTVFSRSQVFQLESTFDLKRYLSSSERAGLAAALHLTETQVGIAYHSVGFIALEIYHHSKLIYCIFVRLRI